LNRSEVYSIIDSERDFQDQLIQDKNYNPNKTVGEFLTLIRTYSNKADAAWTGNTGDNGALEEVRKIAAICVSCMEVNGAKRRSFTPKNTQAVVGKWIKVASSNINAIKYEISSQVLEIKFNDGHVYSFSNVPGTIYLGMVSAPSKGKYFHQNIQGKFQSARIV